MTNQTQRLANIAKTMNLSLTLAVALPETIKVISVKLGMSETMVIRHLETNQELREYVKSSLGNIEKDIAEAI